MSALTDLRDYAATMAEVSAIEQMLERMMPTGAPSGLRGIGAQRGTNDPTAAAMQKFDGVSALLKAKLEELAIRAKRGEQALVIIEDPRERFVMRGYYMLGMTDEKIAEALYRSRSDVQRIRKRAEAWLDEIG